MVGAGHEAIYFEPGPGHGGALGGSTRVFRLAHTDPELVRIAQAARDRFERWSSAADRHTWEAWNVLTERPTQAENPARQQRLRGQLAKREISGRTFDQWQYEVTAGGRIWYCPDEQRRIVWVVAASPRHPKATE